MDVIAAVLHAAGSLAAAIALALGRPRRAAIGLLLGAALLSLGLGAADPGARELVCTHTYAGYAGADLDPSPVQFPTATARAAGWLWPLPYAAFALLWSVALWRRRADAAPGAWLVPLLFAWTACAAWLGMQALAAPAAVVQPFGLERCLWPAGLLLTLRLAQAGGRFLPMLLALSLGIVAQRLPAALFSKLARDRGLGTGLDIGNVTDIVNPLTKQQFEPRLARGSGEQQFWLIWAEHVLFYPAFYLLSLAGIAFAALMLQKHRRMSE